MNLHGLNIPEFGIMSISAPYVCERKITQKRNELEMKYCIRPRNYKIVYLYELLNKIRKPEVCLLSSQSICLLLNASIFFFFVIAHF